MANQAAWIGAAGAIAGALISGGVTLYLSGGSDRRSSLEFDIQAGIQGLARVEDPAERINQLDIIEQLMNTHEVAGWQRLIIEYRQEAEDNMARQAKLEADRERQAQAEAGFEAALATVSSQANAAEELSEIIASAETSLEAQRRALDEEQAAISASTLAAAQLGEETRLAEEAARAVAARELQEIIARERICQDRHCTSWILP
ncbi:MAG: hypothetical protein AAF647_01620 [Pseudomonadota bacterium]